MKKHLGAGALVGGLLTAALTGLMYFADHLAGLPFVPYDLFDWLTRVLPGSVITFGIDLMIDSMRLFSISVADTAKTAEQVAAVVQFVLIGIGVGIFFFGLTSARESVRITRRDLTSGLVVGALFGLPMTAISLSIGTWTANSGAVLVWLVVIFLVWGAALSYALARLSPSKQDVPATAAEDRSFSGLNRRQFLIRLGGATAVITVAGGGFGELIARNARNKLEEELEASMAHQSQGTPKAIFPNSNDPVVPAPGTRPEYTPVKDHYKVFIRVEPTVIDGATWRLPITGLVDNPVMLDLDDFHNGYESMSYYVTLSCISGRLGTDLISTTQWTGVSMQRVLADVKLREDARYLRIRSGDGFYETIGLDEIADDERIMLCYAWDGNILPVDHGFPLRIWRPDRYGMKQPKWIKSIEVIEEDTMGYWPRRGWSEIARVKAVSVVDTVAAEAAFERDGRTFVPVGGMAFAGARGISKVEVRVDGGGWEEAQLRSPLSDTTWVLWRYDWPFQAGDHTFEVRAAERDGTPQSEEFTDNRPDGASGIHSTDANLKALTTARS